MSVEMVDLAYQLLSGDVWNRMGRPYLAVGMRVTGAHHRAAIFENLHVIDLWQLRQFLELGDPGLDHTFNLSRRHGGQGEVVARGETDDPTKSRLAFRDQQAAVFQIDAVVAGARLQRGKVVVKNECAGIARIDHPADAGIPAPTRW